MGVEETNLKSMRINEEENKKPNPNLKEDKVEIEEEDTTLPSPNNYIVEQPHLLEHLWTFWFDNPSAKSRQAAWGSSMRAINTFSTVEQFWSLYNNIHHPSKFAVGADFYCFKYKIEPKGKTPSVPTEFDYGDEICGAVVKMRGRREKIAL